MARKGELTDKQRLFVQHYLVSLNASDASLKAGYSPKTYRLIGSQNLRKPLIATAIRQAMDKRSDKVEIDAAYVLREIKDTIRECREEETRNPQAALNGLELLGRHLAMFTDRTINRNIVEDMSEADLDASIAKLEYETGISKTTH